MEPGPEVLGFDMSQQERPVMDPWHRTRIEVRPFRGVAAKGNVRMLPGNERWVRGLD